jgi:hypothetical protein
MDRRRIRQMIGFYERRMKRARLLPHTGADTVPRMALYPRALLLAANPISRLRYGKGKTKSRGQAQRYAAQSQVSKWAGRFNHQLPLYRIK